MLNYSEYTLLNSLEDITKNIQIKPNFCIQHPNYQSFCLPPDVAKRFKKSSSTLQLKYLSLLLRNLIFGIYYSGYLQNSSFASSDENKYLLHQNLENNSSFGIDWQFYEQLHEYNHCLGFFDSGWQVLKKEIDGSIAVTKGGLTLHIDRDIHLENAKKTINIGQFVDIWVPKNRLQNGYYVAIGNVGKEQQNPDADLGAGRIYFNLTPSGAVKMMDILTQELNALEIPFTFQVLYNAVAYGRYDSGVLYFERHDYQLIQKVLQNVYLENQVYFQPEVPLFTKFLAPGISVAEEPVRKFSAQESFGVNRCQIVANALLSVWQEGEHSPEQRMTAIREHFAQYSINLERPYLNPDSEDIYLTWN